MPRKGRYANCSVKSRRWVWESRSTAGAAAPVDRSSSRDALAGAATAVCPPPSAATSLIGTTRKGHAPPLLDLAQR